MEVMCLRMYEEEQVGAFSVGRCILDSRWNRQKILHMYVLL